MKGAPTGWDLLLQRSLVGWRRFHLNSISQCIDDTWELQCIVSGHKDVQRFMHLAYRPGAVARWSWGETVYESPVRVTAAYGTGASALFTLAATWAYEVAQ